MPGFTMQDFEALKTCHSGIRNNTLRYLASRDVAESAAFLLLVADYKVNTKHSKAMFITEWYINPGGGKQEFSAGSDTFGLKDNQWTAPINIGTLTDEMKNVKRTANFISDRRLYPGLFDPFVVAVVSLLNRQNPPLNYRPRVSPPKIRPLYEKDLIKFSQAVKVAAFDPEECGIY